MGNGGVYHRLRWTLYLKYLLVFGKTFVDHEVRYCSSSELSEQNILVYLNKFCTCGESIN